jgi:hypothetical protein
VLSSTPIKQSFRVPLSCNMCTAPAKTKNILGNVNIINRCSFIHSGQATPLIQVRSFHQQLHNSCETKQDHNQKSAVYTDRLASFPFLHLCKVQCVTMRAAHIVGTTLHRQLYFAQRHIISVSPQYGTCFTAPY